MQKIYPVTLTPQEYLEEGHEQQVQKPEKCLNCHGANCLEALGYYWRWISYLLDHFRIGIRRFRCLECRVSISCLPDFAQPYRVVNTQTIQAGFNGQAQRVWGSLILVYWKKLTAHLPMLLRTVGSAFGRSSVNTSAAEFWELILKECDSLAAATERLVREFRTCLFGTYRCHQRKEVAK